MDLYWVEVCLSVVKVGQTGDIVCQNGVKGLSGVTVERSGIIVGLWVIVFVYEIIVCQTGHFFGQTGIIVGISGVLDSKLKWHHIRSQAV